MQQEIESVEAARGALADANDGERESRLTALLSALLAAFFGLLTAALLAAMAGFHHWFVIAPLAVLIAFGVRRLLPSESAIPSLSRAAAMGLMLVVVGAVLSNVVLRSNLVVAGRDGATYANTAAFLVDGSNLFPDGISEPFSVEDGLSFGAPGFVLRDDGTLWQQFLHSTAAAMGFVGELLGRGAMFSFNAFVSGIGILGLFALGRRFMGEWWALGAATVMGLSLPYVYYSRGSFAEIATLTLIAGGLWTAHAALANQPQLALGGGLLLGGAAVVRVDAWMIGLALAAFLVTTTWLREQQEAWIAGRLFTGFAIAAFIGLLDLALFALPYLTILRSTLIPLLLAVVVVRLLEPLVRSEAIRSLGDRIQSRPVLVGNVVATIGGAIILYLWIVRPLLPPAQIPVPNGLYGLEAIQIRDGIAVDPSRTYFEQSVWWLTWYIGLPLTAIGFMGFVGSLRKSLVRNMAAIRLIILMFAVPALIYLVRPAVNPDQIWAIRRFTPVILPGLVLFA
ncbi:MAG: hypothetical protein HKN91_11840, partial [Acidimicrobiia bacterium]|nr:hypothetical protein [Acidimicrobiia bacterium]